MPVPDAPSANPNRFRPFSVWCGAVAKLKVWLCDWEQECCGPSRTVGDEVTMSVFLFDGEYNEQRHDYDRHGQPITGRIQAIEWCPDIVRKIDEGVTEIVGHGRGVPLASTDERPDSDDDGPWSLAFTIITDDPLPGDK